MDPHSPKMALENNPNRKVFGWGYFLPPRDLYGADINHQIAQHGPKLDPKLPNMGPI
jgi:hypothetical protein